MSRPAVSVLMPVRNAGAWLHEALESLQHQSEWDWELIAVDDGSSDGSGAVLAAAALRDARIRLAGGGPCRAGIAGCLNRALALARAPLVARMDADDRMDPDRLGAQRALLEKDASLFAVTCRVRAFPAASVGEGMQRYLDWQNALVAPEELARERFIESPLLHPTAMMRTVALRERLAGWRDPDWPEDWDLFLRAFERGLRIRRLPRILYDWRQHGSQATRRDPRYGEQALRRARAHFLARHLRAHGAGRELWILGAGPVGKRLARALAAEGTSPAGFADVDVRKIGGRVGGGTRNWPVIDAGGLRKARGRVLGLAAVGQRGARRLIRERLRGWGWVEGEDFLAAA